MRTEHLASYETFSCTQRAEAVEHIAKLYGVAPIKWEMPKPGPFRFGLDIAKIGRATLVRGNFSSLTSERQIDGQMQFIVPLKGHYRISARNQDEVLASASGTVIGVLRPTIKTRKDAQDVLGICVNVALEDLTESLRKIAGYKYRPSMTREIAATIDKRTVLGQILSRKIVNVFDECRLLTVIGNAELAGPLLEDALLNIAAVAAFSWDTTGSGDVQPQVAPELVRRIKSYIDENYASPLTISGLCAVFDISLRALQDNFKRHFGISPKEYLTDCRMMHVRSALEAGAAQSVTTVALENGFTDLSNFALKYKVRFNEQPSQTLRRTRAH